MVYRPKGRKFYLVEFHFQGRRIRKRTKATLLKEARAIESAIRVELERGNYGILRPKPSKTLAEFLKDEFLPFTESRFREAKPNTAEYYEYGSKLLLSSPLAGMGLDTITDKDAAHFISLNSHRSPSTINKGLRTLRRSLNLAAEWGKLNKKPKITLAKGERQRDRVLSHEDAQDYLCACAQPWRDVATLMLATGMRPGECQVLRWESVLLDSEGGMVQITDGKSRAARRILPLMPDALHALRSRHEAQGCPAEGWVFPSKSKSGHLERWGYRDRHARALELIAKAHEINATLPRIAPFEPYCLRHTGLTWIAPYTDAYTLAKIAGHSSILMTMKYIHPLTEAVEMAFKRTAGVPTKVPPQAKSDSEGKAKGNFPPKLKPTE
jgi:integrase